MNATVCNQIESAYRLMATKARYRPAAPSNDELDLAKECREYARYWWRAEDSQTFDIGCCDMSSRRATIFAIEAARNMCAGIVGEDIALRLLKLAVKEMEAVVKTKSPDRALVKQAFGLK